MGIPDADYTNPTTQDGWQHALTIPRLLEWKNGVLHQKPLPQLQALRRNSRKLNAEQLNELHFDEASFELCIEADNCKEMELQLNEEICMTMKEGLFTLDIHACGAGRDQRSVALDHLDDIQIFSDTTSLEIFLNDGTEVFTTRIYPTRPRCVKLNIKDNTAAITLHSLMAHQFK